MSGGNLDQSLAVLIGAITTSILMASSYYFGPGARKDRSRRRRGKHEQTNEGDDE